jgi:anti-sigma regulatory factor (Ser/Thr protein kinase)
LLREALAANQGYAQRVGVSLSGDFSDAAPQVNIDADRFLQVMANLLSNAIKHSAPQDVVRVQLDWSAAHVWVRVIDQGPGIAAQFRARMFEKFSQADGSDQRAQGGTGLGLYISRMLVQRMGARLRVDSVVGAGASFVVEFDVRPASSDADVPWLLHIDADVDARRRVAEWLGTLCRIEGAADLQQARSAMSQGAPRLVLADPQAQGSAEVFCAELRALRPGIQPLLYSDCVDLAFVQRMGLAWLPKSQGSSEELQLAVRAALAPANQVNKS